MDSDDYIEPDYLEKMLEPYQANSSLDLVICNYFNDNTPKENSFITQSKYGIRDRIETMREFANPKSFKGFAWNKLYKLDLIVCRRCATARCVHRKEKGSFGKTGYIAG